jgi:hypothetical protein
MKAKSNGTVQPKKKFPIEIAQIKFLLQTLQNLHATLRIQKSNQAL